MVFRCKDNKLLSPAQVTTFVIVQRQGWGVALLLQIFGFSLAVNTRDNIIAPGLAQFVDFRYLVKKDISDMAIKFGKHTQATGKIIFRLGTTKTLIEVLHPMHDRYWASNVPKHEHYSEATVLVQALSWFVRRILIW